jgi:hypothetical protein
MIRAGQPAPLIGRGYTGGLEIPRNPRLASLY